MNNDRRKRLRIANTTVDDIFAELELLATEEETDLKGDSAKAIAVRHDRVVAWRARLEEAHSLVEDVLAEEIEAQENTRSEDKKDEMQEGITAMEEIERFLNQLVHGQDSATFNEEFRHEYDDVVTNFETALQ